MTHFARKMKNDMVQRVFKRDEEICYSVLPLTAHVRQGELLGLRELHLPYL